MQTFINWCLDNWGVVLFLLGIFVEITPVIKFNPISAVIGWVGKRMNRDVDKRLERLEKRADEQRKSIDENEMDRIRWEVLNFANECRNHERHTLDEFRHIISLNGKYHNLLKKTNTENGVFDAEYEYILEVYAQCQKKDSFD